MLPAKQTTAVLPPLPLPPTAPYSKPPTPPSATKSKTMKKRRRRKKKKKKKPVLVRVNSRESIQEMETIEEAEEEYADYEDEESDYWSTDEDDSSGGRHSRDPSPARSLGSASGFIPPSIEEEPRIQRLPPPREASGSRTQRLVCQRMIC